MTHDEIQELIEFARFKIPKFDRYYRRLPGDGLGLLEIWAKGLKNVAARDAADLFEEIAIGDRELPKGFKWEHLPRLLVDLNKNRRYAMSAEARAEARKQEPDKHLCEICKDSGFATVYHPGFTSSYVNHTSCRERLYNLDPESRAALAEEHWKWKTNARQIGHRTSLTMAAACTCKLGEIHSSRIEGLMRYSPNRLAIHRRGTPRDITEWLETRNENVVEWDNGDSVNWWK